MGVRGEPGTARKSLAWYTGTRGEPRSLGNVGLRNHGDLGVLPDLGLEPMGESFEEPMGESFEEPKAGLTPY